MKQFLQPIETREYSIIQIIILYCKKNYLNIYQEIRDVVFAIKKKWIKINKQQPTDNNVITHPAINIKKLVLLPCCLSTTNVQLSLKLHNEIVTSNSNRTNADFRQVHNNYKKIQYVEKTITIRFSEHTNRLASEWRSEPRSLPGMKM